MDIIAALTDPALFAPHFKPTAKHGDTWERWRAFLRALFAIPPEGDDLATYQACTGRTDWPTQPSAEAALIVGRRGGKSRVLATIAVFLATFRDYTEYLAPGEVATVAVLAANRAQARSIFRYASGMLKAVGLLAPMVVDSNTESITLNNRVVIEISTASFRTTRGYTFAAVLADEIAFWQQDEASANPDIEIMRALRPGLASIPGSILLLASSPYAKKGELYQAFRRHYGQAGARVLVWKASTQTMNPRIDPRIIAEAYETDPEAAAAEYGAEFRSDLADFVTRETIEAVTMIGRTELPPLPGIEYTAFVDPSGGASDAMTLAIGHLSGGAVAVLDAVREARPPFDPEAVVRDFAELLRAYGIDRVTGDRYGGEWPRQRFKEHGISYDPSARPKSDIYIDLLPLVNAHRVELLDLPRLSAQLVGLERRTARSGRDSVDHTPGGHDDVANAVAGVLVGLDLDRRPALIRPAALLVGTAPVPFPHCPPVVAAPLIVSMGGMVACAYFAIENHRNDAPLVLLDFDLAPMGADTFTLASQRLAELSKACRVRYGHHSALWLPGSLLAQVRARRIPAEEIPPEILVDPAGLALSAAGHVAGGRVKLAAPAHEKGRDSPLAGALAFKAGEPMDADPLRLALLVGIAIALEPRRLGQPAAT